MNRWGVVGSMAMVVAANTFVLVGVAIDRSGGVVQKIELTERELPIWGASEDNTGIAVRLWQGRVLRADRALNRAKLTELGFDCNVPPEDPSAEWRYRKLTPRRAFVVLEYDGPAGAAGADRGSNLAAIDAGRDAAALRSKYPDQNRYLIVPELIRLRLSYDDGKPRSVVGDLAQSLVAEIHVPQPYARTLAELRGKPYHLTLCYGKRYEPWICGCQARQP
jgi:hypothetical protein